jgi:hypothetical protein
MKRRSWTLVGIGLTMLILGTLGTSISMEWTGTGLIVVGVVYMDA